MNGAERDQLISLLEDLVAAETLEEVDRLVDLVLSYLSAITERNFGE